MKVAWPQSQLGVGICCCGVLPSSWQTELVSGSWIGWPLGGLVGYLVVIVFAFGRQCLAGQPCAFPYAEQVCASVLSR